MVGTVAFLTLFSGDGKYELGSERCWSLADRLLLLFFLTPVRHLDCVLTQFYYTFPRRMNTDVSKSYSHLGHAVALAILAGISVAICSLPSVPYLWESPCLFRGIYTLAILATATLIITLIRLVLKVEIIVFFVGIAVAGFLIGTVWHFTGRMLPDNLYYRISPNQYYSLEWRHRSDTDEVEGWEEGSSAQRYIHPLKLGSMLYRKDNPDLEKEVELLQRDNECVGRRGWIFWQAGIANGFSPPAEKSTHIYDLSDPVSCLRATFFSFMDAMIKGLLFSPLFMLLQFVWYIKRGNFAWWDEL